MTKQDLIKDLTARGITFNRLRFYKRSPFQAKRYKSEYVGWEAWLYNGKSTTGWLLTQEDYENKEHLKTYLAAYQN